MASDHDNVVCERSLDGEAQSFDLGNKLRVERMIGKGGMGAVFEVHHNVMGVRRAVKVLSNEPLGRSEQALERFRREALIATELSHPSIIKVYDLDRAPDGSPFILMELLEGQDLESVIRNSAPLDLETVIRLLAGPADALDAVHGSGVVHRDLKPANLFLTRTGTVKILDFGISQFAREQDVKITRAGEVLGTPIYMSPEQMRGEHVDGRADVYALATIAYELLVAKTIFMPISVNQLSAAVMLETPRPPSMLVPDLPAHIDAVFERALAKWPDQRYRTSLEFLRDLAGQNNAHLISSVIRAEFINTADSSGLRAKRFSEPEGRSSQSSVALISDASSPDERTKLNPVRARLLQAVLVAAALIVLVGLGCLVLGIIGEGQRTPVEIGSFTITADEDQEWLAEATRRLLIHYMVADDVIAPVVGSARSSMAGDDGGGYPGFSVDVKMAHHRPDGWWASLALHNRAGTKPIWRTSSRASGYDRALEEVTWSLREHLEDSAPVLGTSRSAREEARFSRLAKAALMEQGLLYRVERLAGEMGETPEGRFWSAFGDYLRCASGQSPSVCLREQPFLPYEEVGDASVSLVWEALASWDESDGADRGCAVFESNDPFVRAVSAVLPGRRACLSSDVGICGVSETFWDRYACALDSSSNDRERTSLEYLFRNLDRDDGHSFYGNIDVFFMTVSRSEQGTTWLRRMSWRYGSEESELAALFFALAMGRREASEALIWARRSTNPLPKVGLALQASGWLKEGVRKYSEAMAEKIGPRDEKMDVRDARLFRDSVQPILITREPVLARQWEEEAANIKAEDPLLEEARAIVGAIANGSVSSLCDLEQDWAMKLERDYLCERYDDILREHLVTPQNAPARSNIAFMVAEALAGRTRYDEALRLFEVIEQDPAFRVNHPLASIMALERAGTIHASRGERGKAKECYKRFLENWESLDVPIADYFRVTAEFNEAGDL